MISQGKTVVPAGYENNSVKQRSTSEPLLCTVEIIEYKAALDFAPFSAQFKTAEVLNQTASPELPYIHGFWAKKALLIKNVLLLNI